MWKSILLLLTSATLFAACGESEADRGGSPPAEPTERPEADHGATVKLSSQQRSAAGIEVVAVATRSERAALEANGQLEPAGDRQARVGIRVAGRVASLDAKVGDVVKAGQVLARVESPELGRAMADYVAARAAATLARENAAREKLLFEKKISAEVEWKVAEAEAVKTASEVQAAENRLHALGIGEGGLPGGVGHYGSTVAATSPIAGIVVERPVTLGQMVVPETSMFVVMDLSEVWVMVDVFERDLAQVSVGQRVRVGITAYPGVTFDGNVAHIGAVVEPRSRAVKVRVALANGDRKLKPGMFAQVSLSDTRGTEHEHLFIPVGAVQRGQDGPMVFVPGDEDGEFVPRAVKTGHEANGWVAIDSGLAAGDHVVAAGSFILKSELDKESLGESGHSH